MTYTRDYRANAFAGRVNRLVAAATNYASGIHLLFLFLKGPGPSD